MDPRGQRSKGTERRKQIFNAESMEAGALVSVVTGQSTEYGKGQELPAPAHHSQFSQIQDQQHPHPQVEQQDSRAQRTFTVYFLLAQSLSSSYQLQCLALIPHFGVDPASPTQPSAGHLFYCPGSVSENCSVNLQGLKGLKRNSHHGLLKNQPASSILGFKSHLIRMTN